MIHTDLCDRFGIRYPIFAFTRDPAVVVALAKAGGFGVLGALSYTDEELDEHLNWIDAHIEGRPYGVDVVMPAKIQGAGEIDPAALEAMIPDTHKRFAKDLLARYEVPELPPGAEVHSVLSWVHEKARGLVEVALSHPIKLLANALGPPPADVIARAHEEGVAVAALCGSQRHAMKQVEAGVDILIAVGTEAGGHTGDVASMVLIPEIVDAVGAGVPVLGAGGIGRGRQVAAALALGASGVWTGSLWLTVEEASTPQPIVDKLLAAGSRDTVRSRSLTGKPARMIKTPWTEAWDDPKGPGALPMPFQFMLNAEALPRIIQGAAAGAPGEVALMGSPVGQIVGTMNAIRPTAAVVEDMVSEFQEALDRLAKIGGRG